MQALHLALGDEARLSRRLGEQPSNSGQALLGHSGGEKPTCLRHELSNHQSVSVRQLIFGRNAVLEAARAGRVVKVYQAAGVAHDPRLDEIARLARVETLTPARLDQIAPGVNQGLAAELKPRREWTLKQL